MANSSVARSIPVMDRKIVSISSKRQITIPQKFFNLLGFGNEAECDKRKRTCDSSSQNKHRRRSC